MKTKNIIKLIFLSCLGVGSLTSCLDLDEELYGRLSPETYYQTEEEALSSVVGVYSYLSYMSRAGGHNQKERLRTQSPVLLHLIHHAPCLLP